MCPTRKCHESVLPAYAGMILAVGEFAFVAVGAPRVCGDDPDAMQEIDIYNGCSPRMRG